MPQDPALAFTQNLIQNYMAFKAKQFEVELAERRDRRYGESLNLQRQNIASMIAYRERPSTATFRITSPSQVENISDIVDAEFTNAPVISGKRWGFDKPDRVTAAETQKAIDRIKARLFYDDPNTGEGTRASIDAAIEGRISGGFSAEKGGRATIIEPPSTTSTGQPKLMFRGFGERETSDTTTFPSTGKVTTPPTGAKPPAFPTTTGQKIGDIATRGGRRYRITGFDTDGEPLIDPTPLDLSEAEMFEQLTPKRAFRGAGYTETW